MIQMDLTLIVGCPMRCKFCPQELLIKSYRKRGGGIVFSFENFKKCIDKIPQPAEMNFAGLGEPWLNPSCLMMMLYAHEIGFEITNYTTLMGMPLHVPDQIKHIPFKYFVVHLPDEEGFSTIPIGENYLAVLTKIMQVIPNYKLMCMGTVHHKVLPLLDREVRSDEKGMHSRAGNIPFLKTVKKEGPIECLSSGLVLDHNIIFPNGDVSLCCMDMGMKYILGNLLEDSYESLFEGEAFKKIVAGTSDGEVLCRYCSRSTKRS